MPARPPRHPSRFLTQAALADLADLPASSRWVRRDGLRLHVLDYGGEGVPLLVLPGLASPAVTLDGVARELTDLVRPVVLDPRGHGLSDDGADHSPDALAADAEAVVNGLGLPEPLLLGHGLGARIAAATAVRARVPLRGTLLVDPPLGGPGAARSPAAPASLDEEVRRAREGADPHGAADLWPRWSRRDRELRARWLPSCGEEAVAAAHCAVTEEGFPSWWRAVPAPVTLVYGAESPVVTALKAAEAATAHPGARLVRVPDAGHMVFWDAPRPALRVLRAALTRTLTEPGGGRALPRPRAAGVPAEPSTAPPAAPTGEVEVPEELTAAPGYLARRLYQAYLAAWLRHVDGTLTGPQFAVLQITGAYPGTDQKTVAGVAALDTSTMADVARRLEARGLLARAPSPSDARRKLLRLTEEGHAALDDANRRARALDERLLQAFPASQRGEVPQRLSSLAERWERLSGEC
ncbi:alpha/beta fold hydrolase [Streptomyces sp. AJS327]|uniref:alpha/beta fold hydrolase n=1 Tax=Streptomyces sp. AJS327 TaxID=2545265 RepID=UPI0027E577D8|nr:alpha/beta fold hydrolase [Streptomyces sp. AJS327]